MRGGKKSQSKAKPAKKSSPEPAVVVLDGFPERISAQGLMALTGFGDSWHRKVAARGYFPPPVDGKYVLVATLQGLFKFQRELTEKAKGQLAAKQELLLDKKIEQADFDLSVAKKEFKPTGEISQKLMAISEEQKSALQFWLLDHLPAINAGLDATAQRANNRKCMVEICNRFQDWARKYLPESQS